MKKLIKKALTGFLIAAVLIGAILIVFGGQENLKTEITKTPAIPSFEKLPKTTPLPSTENLTEGFTKVIAKAIVDKNPAGPEQSAAGRPQIAAPDPAKLVQTIIADGIKNFDLNKLRPTVGDADIKIIAASDKASQETYFKNFYLILERDFQGVIIDQENPEKTNFPVLNSAFDRAISDFYALPVPQPLVDIHKKQIVALGTAKNIYLLISNYETDPVQALLAFEAGPKISDESLAVLKQIDDYVAKNQLSI